MEIPIIGSKIAPKKEILLDGEYESNNGLIIDVKSAPIASPNSNPKLLKIISLLGILRK